MGDFNGDRAVDLAVILAGADVTQADQVQVLLNNGSGTFSVAPSFTTEVATSCRGLTAADMDADAAVDLVVSCSGSFNGGGFQGTISILANNAMGGFVSSLVYSAPGDYSSYLRTLVEDINADGALDLVSIERDPMGSGGGLRFVNFANNGTGGFVRQASGTGVEASFPHYATAGDMDNDGDVDFLGFLGGNAVWWENTDGASFQQWELNLTHYPRFPENGGLLDYDNNGALDVVGVTELPPVSLDTELG